MRRGFTVLEILICIGVITLLLAVAIPAVHNARQSARLMDCKNRIKQVTLASHAFHETYGHFPVEGTRFGSLLPFVEQQNLYDTLNLKEEYKNLTSGLIKPPEPGLGLVTAFVCPNGDDDGAKYEFSYAANQGSLPSGVRLDGKSVFFVANGVADLHYKAGDKVTISDVYDGTSNTAFYAEQRPLRQGELQWTSDIAHLANASEVANSADLAVESKQVTSSPRRTFGNLHNSTYNHFVGPNGRTCFFPKSGSTGTNPARGYHTGGMNVSKVDGSVQFVSDDIDLQVWHQLGSRDSRLE